MTDRFFPRLVICLAGAALSLVPLRSIAGAGEAGRAGYGERWVYCSANLQVDQSVKDVIALLERAKKSGYTSMLIADYKLQVLDRVPDFYFRNVQQVKEAARRCGIELVPAVFSIGYSNGHLSHDPNLAEGLPVVDQPYIVKRVGGRLEATLDTRNPARFQNGGLEQARGDRFAGFGLQDDPGVTTFADRRIFHGGRASCRIEPGARGRRESGVPRLMQRVALRPMTPYRFSCWARTKDLAPVGAFQMLALGAGQPGRQLTFHDGLIQSNQDWKRIEVVFNSLDQTEVNLYVGIWGQGPGTLWVDDLQLEELPLVNVLRRPGCPLTVRSASSGRIYEEGRDFERVVDPSLGAIPWPGEYSFNHPGAKIRMESHSGTHEGDRLSVSWYHPVITVDSQVMCCLSEPRLEQILRDQAERVNRLFQPRTFFMSHDEIRVANWCKACRDRKLTPGEMLAENARICTRILKTVNPKARIVAWSDMFDPNHNAVDNYYLVNGPLKGSWDGLAKDVIVANWNSGKARESLGFFEGRGHRQLIAGYYDVDDLSNFKAWDAAARDIPGVMGFMYTTWASRYGQLESYGEALEAARRP